MRRVIQSRSDGKRQERRGILHVSDVRMTIMVRTLEVAFWSRRMEPNGDTGRLEVELPGDPAAPPSIAAKPRQRILSFLVAEARGEDLSEAQKRSVADAQSEYNRLHGPEYAVRFFERECERVPALRVLSRLQSEVFAIGSPSDGQVHEGDPCEVAKPVVGAAIAQGHLGPNEYMKGKRDQPKTGLPCIPERATQRLVRTVRAGKIVLELVDLLPSCPIDLTEVMAQGASDARVASGLSGKSGAPYELELRVLHQSATRLLRNVERAHCNALATIEAAKAQDEEQKDELERVRHEPAFTAFAQRLGLAEDLRVALHLWAASSCANKSLDLHLDSLDVPFLLNAIAAIGVDCGGTVVRLRGAYLMVVLQWSEEPLHAFELPPGLEGMRAAHDDVGNIVLLEPPTLEVALPHGANVARTPETRLTAKTMLGEGRAVIAYFGSGGLVLGQLASFWHMVTPMDPRDVLAHIIRVSCILYPTSSAVVAGAATRDPSTCTWERAQELAQEWGAGVGAKKARTAPTARGSRATEATAAAKTATVGAGTRAGARRATGGGVVRAAAGAAVGLVEAMDEGAPTEEETGAAGVPTAVETAGTIRPQAPTTRPPLATARGATHGGASSGSKHGATPRDTTVDGGGVRSGKRRKGNTEQR